MVILFMSIGSIVGGVIPLLWGDSGFSYISILTSGIGGILGVFIGFKISNQINQ